MDRPADQEQSQQQSTLLEKSEPLPLPRQLHLQDYIRLNSSGRRRFSRYLHDILCQQLTGISIMSQLAEQQAKDEIKADLTRINTLIDQAVWETRAMALLLMAEDQAGVNPTEALAQLVKVIQKLFDITCTFTVEQDETHLSAETSQMLVNIGIEAIDQAIYFRKARRVAIRWRSTPQETRLLVEDDGQPDPPESKEFKDQDQLLALRAQLIAAVPLHHRNETGWNVFSCTLRPTNTQDYENER